MMCAPLMSARLVRLMPQPSGRRHSHCHVRRAPKKSIAAVELQAATSGGAFGGQLWGWGGGSRMRVGGELRVGGVHPRPAAALTWVTRATAASCPRQPRCGTSRPRARSRRAPCAHRRGERMRCCPPAILSASSPPLPAAAPARPAARSPACWQCGWTPARQTAAPAGATRPGGWRCGLHGLRKERGRDQRGAAAGGRRCAPNASAQRVRRRQATHPLAAAIGVGCLPPCGVTPEKRGCEAATHPCQAPDARPRVRAAAASPPRAPTSECLGALWRCTLAEERHLPNAVWRPLGA